MARITITVIMVVLLQVSSVAADYQLTVTVYSYSNPENKCAACRESPREAFGCCDNHFVKDAAECAKLTRSCEIVVSMCLRQPTSRIDTALCPSENLGHTKVMRLKIYTFDPQKPFTSMGKTWNTSNSQLYVTLVDADFGEPLMYELVDSFPLNLTVGERFNRTMLTGHFGLATIELSLSLECTENYYGPDCSLFRICSQPPCTCDPGFTGEFCQTNINECSGVDCSGSGVCIDGVNSYTCQCEDGYTGSYCQVNIAGAVIGTLAAGCVLLVFIIIVMVALLLRTKKKQQTDNVELTQQLNAPFLENDYEIRTAGL